MSHSFCSFLQSHAKEYGILLCIILTSVGAMSLYAHIFARVFFQSCKLSMSNLHVSIESFALNNDVAIELKSFYALGFGSTDIIAIMLLAAHDIA